MIVFFLSLSTCHKCGKDKVAINAFINRGVGKNICIFVEENLKKIIAFFIMNQYNLKINIFFNSKKMQINKPFANISISINFLDYVTNMEPHDSISFLPKAGTNK